ncbi:MAG: DUF2309 domain-containing protein [Wenzhouxiangella sp.]|jgi:uncharacterized protein YbcC (UPF0753/DUF2309 family)|nr:DUF2309 domain-containing protein [Wenzhouxiangella sp.]
MNRQEDNTMAEQMTLSSAVPATIANAIESAIRQIPPVWPLASFVAVNPFLGQVGETMAATAARLARVGGTPMTMPRQWYRQHLSKGQLTEDDLAAAWAASPHQGKPRNVAALSAALSADRPAKQALATLSDLASSKSGSDWSGLFEAVFGTWAGSYFDRGQALWAAPEHVSAWAAYRAYATHDLTPEIMGVKGYAGVVAGVADESVVYIARAVGKLGIGDDALATYFHQLLLSLGGWSQMARQWLWQAELAGGSDRTLVDLLAIRLLWEEVLYDQYQAVLQNEWTTVLSEHAAPVEPTPDDIVDEILQEAMERAAQRALATTLVSPQPAGEQSGRAVVQAAFCIDVRSEVFRRALESVDSQIQTLGFAGFFGIFTRHRRFASDVEEHHLPVLLNSTVSSCSGSEDQAERDLMARYAARARRAWGRFKLAAISSFAFVEAMGPVYIAKLLRDALGLNPTPVPDDPTPRFAPDLDEATRIDSAETVLRAMSLTDGFGRIVLLTGHGANVVNNPHASGLHCGACGGYSGEVNARLLAGLLNDPAVRQGLVERAIEVPADTVFIGALHDTTTDTVTTYEHDLPPDRRPPELGQIHQWLAAAGQLARSERALRLPRAESADRVAYRARDWAEVRPEWGLAGCKAFIAAPRERTSGCRLEGRAFLHDYDWRPDRERGFAVLELILTAPVVVASWISLQYYGSTVAPQTFGSGNKLLHNVVGGVGVVEGNGGLLRAGLPWQSVHDGEDYVHEPLRLTVCIEAPTEAMSEILARHELVRQLFDNRWLHLFAMDENGGLAWRYSGNLEWQPAVPAAETTHRSARVA